MYSQITVTLLLLGCAYAREIVKPLQPLPVCATHEKYIECGTACPTTCENKNEVRICEEICVAGCFCEEGYVKRNDNGPCVPLQSCDAQVEPVEPIPICPLNEEFHECGTACPTTCQNKNEVRVCNDICISGCFCQKGYVRSSENGACVPEDSCDSVPIIPIDPMPVCKAHEEFRLCGTACPTTCQNRNKPIVCEEICVPGCFCEEGYVRSSENGACVREEVCEVASRCQEHEVFSECATMCPATCDNDGEIEMCPDICLQGCVCEEGYIKRSANGPCVPKNSCSLTN